jgi:hypothetical protein
MQLGEAMRARGGKCGGVQTVPVCVAEKPKAKKDSLFRFVGCLAVDEA